MTLVAPKFEASLPATPPLRDEPVADVQHSARINDSSAETRISFCFIIDAIDAAKLPSVRADEVLAQAGIAPELQRAASSTVTLDQFCQAWRGLSAATGDELFGLDSRGMPNGSFAVLCQAALSSVTLEDAVERSLRFLGVMLSDFDGQLVRRDGQAWIELGEMGESRPPLFYLTVFLMLTGFCSWLVDRRVVVDRATFRGLEPVAAAEYRRLFCDRLQFNASKSSISFDAKFLAMRPHRNEAQMQDFLQRSPRDLLTQYRNCDSLPGRIWQRLRDTAPNSWPSFKVLAATLNTTPSTLRRRLDNANNSYQRLKDGVRQELAMDALSITRQPIAEIAKDLGYEDPSAFYRAFRKWTGLTPNVYRTSGTGANLP